MHLPLSRSAIAAHANPALTNPGIPTAAARSSAHSPLKLDQLETPRFAPQIPRLHSAAASLTAPRNTSAQAFKLGDLFKFGDTKDNSVEIPTTTFADVAGIDEAKLELGEVVEFLQQPEKFTDVGASIPRGVLLAGPPGTGKTLLARAVAGEAGVPFYAKSGSEFVEMFVGMGASRVRSMFEEAQQNAPCIIFIDEIDAVGRNRGAAGGISGGGDEREQTLNQLLTEMDGFEGNTGVIVLAATNRTDVLDGALTRPGRFDRQVEVGLPDHKGRCDILEVHARNKKLAPGVKLEAIAARTPGFSGASLANLMNEGAINTVRRGADEISLQDIDEAVDRIYAGAAKVGGVMTDKKKQLVAFHEAGHALVGALLPDYDPVQKISIVPRGDAGGLTWFTPSEDRIDGGLYTNAYLKNRIAVALGGRVAEDLVFGRDNATTGASSDFQSVAATARQMVTQFGMSALGPWSLDNSSSQKTAQAVDVEVKKLVDEGYDKAVNILTEFRPLLDGVAQRLIQNETVSGDEFADMLQEYTASNSA